MHDIISKDSLCLCFAAALIRLPWWLNGKESACQCRRCRFDPWVRKIPWRREWQPAQNFCLENPMDRGAWQAIVHRVTKESDMKESDMTLQHD